MRSFVSGISSSYLFPPPRFSLFSSHQAESGDFPEEARGGGQQVEARLHPQT